MNRARKSGGAGGSGAKNSVIPAMGTGKGTPKPIKNAIATKPGSNSGKVKNAIGVKC